ncbi:MAG: hypothetical protein ACMG6E_07045 [Candidatus Roizmanbacteria bacterium]
MGEYGSKITNLKKTTKIIDNLCMSAYRTLEDELTRVYIINAITKLHVSMGFTENHKIEAVMGDYIQSKNIEVQQRAIEYKQLKEHYSKFPSIAKDILLNTPLNEN